MKTKFHYFGFLFLLLGVLSSCKDGLYPRQPNIQNEGRAIAVAVKPNQDAIMVVASETGGLFQTENAGDKWEHVGETFNFRYRDLLFYPPNPEIIVAAARQDTRVISGGGIYRSTDDGETWSKATMNTPSSNCLNNMSANCLSFDESNNRLWAGTNCGLFYSDDQGVTWEYLSGATGLGSRSVRAIATPSENKMVVLTGNSIRVSTNGGSSWTLKINGLPGNRRAAQHNQIAVSPLDDDHIYFAFNYSKKNSNDKWERFNALYYTQDFGDNWSIVENKKGWNRPPFVVLTNSSLNTGRNKIDLYYSNGGSKFKRREVNHGSIHGFGAWETLTIDHADIAELAISNDGKTPILLLSDGGLHTTNDNGSSWTMNSPGYNALQITEITGQNTEDDGLPDLYFGTQDNHNWASTNYGIKWPNKKCCEGFYLNVPRESLTASNTTHTGVACFGCNNYKSGPGLVSVSSWNNPPRSNGSPALVDPQRYVQIQYNIDSSAWRLARTTNTGANWTSSATVNNKPKSFPLVVGNSSNPIVFLATEQPGTVMGNPKIGIERISGTFGSTFVESQITGFGNVGIFPTMFAWYEVFAVDPDNPSFIIVPDIANDVVVKSDDGGATWTQDNNLTDLVTNFGEFKFHWDKFSQISSFGFDPDCSGHIMVGTQQAGIFETFDNGDTWKKVSGSEKVPYVGSFFFSSLKEVLISSYGRGLWVYRYKCPSKTIIINPNKPILELDKPKLWLWEDIIPLDQMVPPQECEDCAFIIINEGEIVDLNIDPESLQVEEILIDNGSAKQIDLEGKEKEIKIKVNNKGQDKKINCKIEQIAELLSDNHIVKGLYLKNGKFNGLFYMIKISIRQIYLKENP
ncbi:WD40/YVTN/BNR-like repeat-containing protein [Mangrovivirga cuniculi]|uniref:Sortilin N-terminal domain-containing protein n=1 Tax=Mangrovivirga cuniculi TaxID=2715131 RepID=A0A4D7JM77_9BACT|nr:exo-alpha-sialidase [Mangrovivirga cuniculi]QCK16691.1 hypothetical protein DCC35_19110 [Mangrovivirga cuniculi]